jgi:hypothetical protein
LDQEKSGNPAWTPLLFSLFQLLDTVSGNPGSGTLRDLNPHCVMHLAMASMAALTSDDLEKSSGRVLCSLYEAVDNAVSG